MWRPARSEGFVRWAAILGVLLGGQGSGMSDDQPAAAQSPASVTVAVATLKDITPSASYVGRVQAPNIVNLVARVSGFLQQRTFEEGQRVKTGDLLFVIEQDTYKAAVAQAEGALAKAQATERNAELTVQRSRELIKTNAVAQATVDQNEADHEAAKADVLSAQAALQQTQINLSYTEIRAPIEGRIGMALVTVGNFVSATSGTLATIVSQDPIYVLFPVSAQEVLDYKQRLAGNPVDNPDKSANVVVRLRLPNGQDYPHPGSVNFLDIQVNQGTDTMTVRAKLPNPEGWLVTGQIVDVAVEAGEAKQALTIPQAAIQIDQSGPYVLIVDPDNKVQQQRVKLGTVEGSDIVVEQGLKSGNRVIVQGIQKVRPGQEVAPMQAVEASP